MLTSDGWLYISRILFAVLILLALPLGRANAQLGTYHLAFTTQPSTAQIDTPMSTSVVVSVENSSGAVVTGSSALITLNIGSYSNPSTPGILAQTTLPALGTDPVVSAYASSGIATFDNLILTAAGNTKLVATSPGITSGTSTAIDVTSPTAIFAAYPPMPGDGDYSIFTGSVVPHINGVILNMSWAAVDNTGLGTTCIEDSGHTNSCNWSTIDSEIETYTALTNNLGVNLKVGLLVYPASDSKTNTATPPYVFTAAYASSLAVGIPPQDLAACPFYPGDGDSPIASGDNGVWNQSGDCWSSGTCGDNYDDTSGIPVVWEAPFKTAYTNFIDQVLIHYSSNGHGDGPTIASSLAYIRFGTVNGGEAEPVCHNDWPPPTGLDGDPSGFFTTYGYADFVGSYTPIVTGYTAFLDQAILAEITANASTVTVPIVQSTLDPTFVTDPVHQFSDQEATIAENFGIGIGMESLSTNDPDASNPPIRDPSQCQEDWCDNFAMYYTNSSPLYLQVITPSAQTIFPLQPAPAESISATGAVGNAYCESICAFTSGGYPNPNFGYVSITGTSNTNFNNPFIYGSSQFTVEGGGPVQTGFTFVNTAPNGTASNGSVYAPDFIPTTYPFAVQNYATSLESNMCDLYYAYYSMTVGSCPTPVAGTALGSSANYGITISSISGN